MKKQVDASSYTVTGQDVSDTVEDMVRAVEAIILEAEPRFFR